MVTTLILNREYKKLLSAKNSLRDFCYVQFFYCTLAAQVNPKIEKSKATSNSAGAVIKLARRVYSRNSEASVSNDG